MVFYQQQCGEEGSVYFVDWTMTCGLDEYFMYVVNNGQDLYFIDTKHTSG